MRNKTLEIKKLTAKIAILSVLSILAGCGKETNTTNITAEAENSVQEISIVSESASESSSNDIVESVEQSTESVTADEAADAVTESESTTDASLLTEKETEQKEETTEETKNSNDATSDESYILLADGTKIYEGQSIKASDIAGAKFILQGVPQDNYWSVSFLSWGPCSANDPDGNWAYDQTTDAGGEISLDWPASTLDEFPDTDYLYVGISTKDYSFIKDWNFKIIR